MLATRFTELVGCSIPIQQAGLGRLANPELAAAVASVGGLGLVGIAGADPEWIARTLDETRERAGDGGGAIGVNVLLPFVKPDEITECLRAAAAHAQVVDFFWGDPAPALVEIVHTGGALASWQVGSVREAVAAAQAGCDFIIAQGVEAGGHVRGRTGLLALLDQVLPAVDIPVLAAGGIGSGRAMAAALAAGAAGVRVGTRFVATPEAHAHPIYVQALIAAQPEDTVYTEAFGYGWEHAPHRVLRASLAAAEAFEGEVVGHLIARDGGKRTEFHRFQPLSATDEVLGTVEAMPHWAGYSVGSVTRVQPATEIVQELASEAERLLRTWR
ncbi:MAG TPA: nitronate monooxygenase [Ktedonobacterales bacterium]|nr:nitronate monooxygenase [Ktedonobacterales bacterium]